MNIATTHSSAKKHALDTTRAKNTTPGSKSPLGLQRTSSSRLALGTSQSKKKMQPRLYGGYQTAHLQRKASKKTLEESRLSKRPQTNTGYSYLDAPSKTGIKSAKNQSRCKSRAN